MSEERLQKIISQSGLCSRRKAEGLIRQKRVYINDQVAKIGDKANTLSDIITIDGNRIRLESKYKVILLNKPAGIISSCFDDLGRKTVIELIPEHMRKGIYPIGRLDSSSRGAILLSNHGELTMRLTHPRFAHNKKYEVLVEGIVSKYTLNKWSDGIVLDGKLTNKSKIKLLGTSSKGSMLEITMNEGRNRQIRRTSELLGHQVIDLKRTEISNIRLGSLKEGAWRVLSKNEWINLLNKVDK